MFFKNKLFKICLCFFSSAISTHAWAQKNSNPKTSGYQVISSVTKAEVNDFDWDSQRGETGSVTLSIPDKTISFSILIHGSEAENFFLINELTDPSGAEFVSENPKGQDIPKPLPPGLGQGAFFSPNQFLFNSELGGYAGLLVPNNPRLKVKPGVWKLKVKAFEKNSRPAGMKPKITLLIKSLSAPITSKTRGQLNINLQFTGSDGLKAQSLKKNPEFQAEIQRLIEVYKKASIDINIVGAQNIKTDTTKVVVGEKSGSDLFKMGKISNGVNLIFCEEISLVGNPYPVHGLSSSILGPQLIDGSFQNGVLISTKKRDPLLRQAPLALIMAHEIGHFLGLPHTSNHGLLGGDDPFSDTIPADDYDYLMQDGLDHEADILTEQQKYQLMLSPAITLVRP